MSVVEYRAKVWKEELMYRFDAGVLTCSSSTHGTMNTLSLDLNETAVTISQDKGWPSQFKFSLYGVVLGTGICGFMGVNDYLDGNTVGLIGTVFAWLILECMMMYFLFKSRRKYLHFILRTKDKGGINVICSHPEKAREFEGFTQEIRSFLETQKGQLDAV